jgi:cytochrome c biogenesis protein CcmG/thiol:disulfide interchange protein DsbE
LSTGTSQSSKTNAAPVSDSAQTLCADFRRPITRICALALAFLISASAYAIGQPGKPAGNSLLNKSAPEITRKDLSGSALALRNYRGKVVLLNFWATWCAPCQLEMPIFAKWQNQYGPAGLQIIGISMDDDSQPARKLVSKLKLNYPVAMGDVRLGERYGGVLGLPLTYLIDRRGVVRARFQGETELKTIERRMKLMLSDPQ